MVSHASKTVLIHALLAERRHFVDLKGSPLAAVRFYWEVRSQLVKKTHFLIGYINPLLNFCQGFGWSNVE